MPALLTLADAKAAIRMPASDATRNSDLENVYIPAVEAPIVDLIGPVFVTPFTRAFDGGQRSIVLGHTDVSVTDVTISGASTAFVPDLSAGIVYRDDRRTPFPQGIQNVTIRWTAGSIPVDGAVPANIVLAGRIILAHLWQADQQGYRQNVAPAEGVVTTPSGFAIPNRAAELLGALLLPGIA